MKISFLLLFLFYLTGCMENKKSAPEKPVPAENTSDTILAKQQHELKASYEVGFYSKSYSYFWIVGKDTLDCVINATEYVKDSSLHLNVYHKKPMLFTVMLANIYKCIPLIEYDFDITKFSSIYFKAPVYYPDLTKALSSEYEQKFERKNITYQKLNEFLLTSILNKQIDSFISPLNKKVERYSIEKFHLIDKAHYGAYLPDTDIKDYPAFAIAGMGVHVKLQNK